MGASSEIMLVLNVTRILTFDLFGIQFVTPPLPLLPTPRKVRWKVESCAGLRGKLTVPLVRAFVASRARGEYLRTHFKNMREVAAALTGQFS